MILDTGVNLRHGGKVYCRSKEGMMHCNIDIVSIQVSGNLSSSVDHLALIYWNNALVFICVKMHNLPLNRVV